MKEPTITVGICDHYPEISGRCDGCYRPNGITLNGEFMARPRGGEILLCDGHGREIMHAPEIRLSAERGATFTLYGVKIGVDFHWERLQEQTFPGDLILLANGGGLLTAINELSVETYLESVISSEMSEQAPVEFLKAHAIASRSWLVAMLQRRKNEEDGTGGRPGEIRDGERIIRWYDREEHQLFDVCADDHCQRYQGMTCRVNGAAAEAVRATRGVFLIHEGRICDARYHKACGGMTEDYATCWEDKVVPYLSHVSDSIKPQAPIRTEQDAERWILSSPDVFCNVRDQGLLDRILPDYDRETADFFRWRVGYKREELEEILRTKTGIDFGTLQSLVPLERGASGRISRLGIEGTKARITVGKELEIRRLLSRSHLYSSAFIVVVRKDRFGVASEFILHGAGWGHGVGLCQIGAAAMAARGLTAEEILLHYFSGAALVKRY